MVLVDEPTEQVPPPQHPELVAQDEDLEVPGAVVWPRLLVPMMRATMVRMRR